MPTIARERQIHANLQIGRPDGVTWTDVSDYLASATVELGDISGTGTGQSGVDGVVRRASFVLRNDRALNVLLWPADGTVLGDRLLPGDDTVDGAADEGEWLSRLLDQTPDYYGDSFAPRDRLSAWNQFDVDGDGTPEYAPLLWPNREAVLRVRIDGPVGQGTTAVVDDLGMADGATGAFALSKRPVAESSETVTQKLPYRWTDYADKTWAELTDRTWVSIKEEQQQTRGVDYTINYEAGTIAFATTPEAGVFIEAEYGYWVTLFHGLLGDSIRTSGPTVECDARDLAKRLQDAYILTPREYGSEAGTPAEDVIQQIIDDNLGAGEVTLYFPSGTASDPRPIAESPGFMVTPYVVEYMSVWDAIQQVAAQFGWFLGYRWHPNTGRMQLILMEPPRNKDASTADFHFSWEDDIYTQDLEITDRDIRNVVTVTYRNAATGERESVTVQDTDSIATYGPRAMQIEEGDASLIDTPEEAERLANAALADLKDMTATTQLQMPLLPTLDVFSGIVVTDPRLSSTDDFFGVEQVRHTLDFEARQFRTEVVAAGRVIGGHHRWLRMQTRPGANAPPSPERVVGGGRVMPKPTNVTATGIIRGIAVDVPPPPVNINRWAETEVHISSTSGFTPDASTLKDAGKKTHFEITSGLVAGTTYYLRAFYVDLKGNKSAASDEVSAVAGQADKNEDIKDGHTLPRLLAWGYASDEELIDLTTGDITPVNPSILVAPKEMLTFSPQQPNAVPNIYTEAIEESSGKFRVKAKTIIKGAFTSWPGGWTSGNDRRGEWRQPQTAGPDGKKGVQTNFIQCRVYWYASGGYVIGVYQDVTNEFDANGDPINWRRVRSFEHQGPLFGSHSGTLNWDVSLVDGVWAIRVHWDGRNPPLATYATAEVLWDPPPGYRSDVYLDVNGNAVGPDVPSGMSVMYIAYDQG